MHESDENFSLCSWSFAKERFLQFRKCSPDLMNMHCVHSVRHRVRPIRDGRTPSRSVSTCSFLLGEYPLFFCIDWKYFIPVRSSLRTTAVTMQASLRELCDEWLPDSKELTASYWVCMFSFMCYDIHDAGLCWPKLNPYPSVMRLAASRCFYTLSVCFGRTSWPHYGRALNEPDGYRRMMRIISYTYSLWADNELRSHRLWGLPFHHWIDWRGIGLAFLTRNRLNLSHNLSTICEWCPSRAPVLLLLRLVMHATRARDMLVDLSRAPHKRRTWI